MQKNDPKVINGWCIFDWANSVYSLVITATIFPIYYDKTTRLAFEGDLVRFFGFEISNTALYSYSISFSFLLVALFSPILSGIADFGGSKKSFMRFFTVLGSLSCFALAFFTGENIELGILASITASVGYSGALVFYNAYLPEIATPDRYDSISARGYSLGYAGSVLLLVVNLAALTYPESFGLADGGQAARMSFVTVGLWWLGFSQITFNRLPKGRKPASGQINWLTKGLEELKKAASQLKTLPQALRFLIAFFFFNAGVQTVIYLAAIFGEKTLHLASEKLIATVLLLQVVAIIGAKLSAVVSEKKGNIFTLTLLIFVWIGVCVSAYFVHNEYQFYALAAAVGAIMGGVQSLARATYSKLLPPNTSDTASFFSFYDVLEKGSIVVGTFVYGLIDQLTGDMRYSSLSLTVFFIISLFFLIRVRLPKVVSPAPAQG